MTNMSTQIRDRLPQLDGGLFLTDGGIETTLIFHDGFELPIFAAFMLLESERGRAALRAYFDRYVPMASQARHGFILESPTWRANPDWGAKLGYDHEALARINRAAIDHDARDPRRHETSRIADGDQRLHRPARRWLRSWRAS